MERVWIGLGALAGLGAVAMAAAAAHMKFDAAQAQMLRDAVQMQGWHALALLACGLWGTRGGRWSSFAGSFFILGLLFFCGAIYSSVFGASVFRGVRASSVAPFGGVMLMTGWAMLLVSVLRKRR